TTKPAARNSSTSADCSGPRSDTASNESINDIGNKPVSANGQRQQLNQDYRQPQSHSLPGTLLQQRSASLFRPCPHVAPCRIRQVVSECSPCLGGVRPSAASAAPLMAPEESAPYETCGRCRPLT